MKLSQFIVENIEIILGEWVIFARSIQPEIMTTTELRNHAEYMLRTIVADLESPQTELEQSEKSKGRAPRLVNDTAAETHADARLKSGFSIDLLAAEYRALRASVLKLWLAEDNQNSSKEADDLIRFNEAIDQSLAESLARYTKAVELSHNIFLGVLGHDLRDPLNSIGAGAQMLTQVGDRDSRTVKLGTQIYNSVLRMSKLIDNLLNFTESQIGGSLNVSVAYVDLAQISKDVVAEFRLSNPDRIIQNTVEGNCAGQWDLGRLSQVYQNLVSNALQYGSKESNVVLLTKDYGDHVVFTVKNNGEPIPFENQHQIFKLMHRGSHTNAEGSTKKNLGLGLYIVREIVNAHHGDISVSSNEQEGTTFRVTLPKSYRSAHENKTMSHER